jgi:uncharacterized protein
VIEILVSASLLGLVSAGHCAGMCGGIVAAFNLQSPRGAPSLATHLAYNLGRIVTYAALGALAGALGGAGLLLEHAFPVQTALRIAANFMLIALGLYLVGFTRLLAPIERIGHALWRRIQPLTRRFLPAGRPHRAFALGALWGLLPCGLVYSVMVTALASGGAERGALTMLAFGAGTLPALLFAGSVLRQPRRFMQIRAVRAAFGGLVVALGLFGIMHAVHAAAIG